MGGGGERGNVCKERENVFDGGLIGVFKLGEGGCKRIESGVWKRESV